MRNFKVATGVVLSALLLPLMATANEQLKDAKQALQQLRQQQSVEFGYQRYSQFGDRTMLEQHQPQVEEQPWVLLKENDVIPSAHRLDEYRGMKYDEQRAGDSTDEQQQSVRLSLTTLVQEQTLEYLEQRQWRGQVVRAYRFEPNLEKFSEHNDKLQGHLYLATDSDQLKGLAISLKESFSPAFSVTLDNFHLQIEMMQIENNGQAYVVPERTEEQVSGRYLFFKGFNEHTVREYSDYQVFAKPAADK